MGKMIFIKIRSKKGQPHEYKNSVDINNPRLLALVFSDLENHGANINKAFEFFKREREANFPW